MTSPNHQTHRQRLGQAIRCYREERRLTIARAADLTRVDPEEFKLWEEGLSVPRGEQWVLLKKYVHYSLGSMSEVHQRACDEEARETDATRQERIKQKTIAMTNKVKDGLTHRPFAAIQQPVLKVVKDPDPAPVSTPATTEDVPETLLGDDFDLRPAYREVQRLPDGWNTAEAKAARISLARELVEAGLTNAEIVTKVKAQFGVGISPNTLSDVRSRVQAAKTRAANKAAREAEPKEKELVRSDEPALREYADMFLRKSPSIRIEGEAGLDSMLVRKFGKSLPINTLVHMQNEARSRGVVATVPTIRPNDIEGAVRLILEAIPNLKSFKIEVDEDGQVRINHTTREVRVVEETGTLTIKK